MSEEIVYDAVSQAHMMSVPEPDCTELDAAHTEIRRLCAALTHMTDAMEAMELKLKGDIAERDAEIEQANREYEQAAKYIEALGLVSTIHPGMQIDVMDPMKMARDIIEYVERLRKGVMPNAETESQGSGRPDRQDAVAGDASAKTRMPMAVADALDPRLGTQQPEGEPCAPMSGRLYRWGTL